MFKQLRVNTKLAFYQFLKNRNRYVSDKNFLIIASVLVGISVGFAAVILKTMVAAIQQFCESGFDVKFENYLYLVFPLIGILLSTTYIRLFHYKKSFYKGLSSIIYSINKSGSSVERHKTFSHIITSALTVGFGGSVGLEAPIAVTGSAIGSNAGKDLLVTKNERTLLLASGAAAGIAAAFNSPIAGVIFAFEVLLTEVSIPAFIPLLMAAASGAVVSRIFGLHNLFEINTLGWQIKNIPFYLILALFCGLVSVYMMRTTIAIESRFGKLKNIFPRAIFGGILLGLLIFIFPPLYGEGYGIINKLMLADQGSLFDRSLFYHLNQKEWFVVAFALAIILVKALASSITIGAGGNGGIFGPSLFVGALLGFVTYKVIMLLNLSDVRVNNFIALGMCGLISGVLHAPLTAIFLIAEITGGYALIIPLMLVSATSYFTTRYFEKHSIYTKKLAEQGLISFNKDTDVLSKVNLQHLIDSDYSVIHYKSTLGQLVELITKSSRNVFAVVDDNNLLRGIITIDDIRDVMFNQALYQQTKVRKLMSIPRFTTNVNAHVTDLINKFDEFGVWSIPVLDEDDKYLGFITKTALLNKYREILVEEQAV